MTAVASWGYSSDELRISPTWCFGATTLGPLSRWENDGLAPNRKTCRQLGAANPSRLCDNADPLSCADEEPTGPASIAALEDVLVDRALCAKLQRLAAVRRWSNTWEYTTLCSLAVIRSVANVCPNF